MKKLKGKVAFVTGGASGIGLAMVRVLLARGMAVALADRDPEYLDEAKRLPELMGRDVFYIALDVTDRDAMTAARSAVRARFGAVSLLCNNAGMTASSSIEEADFTEWDRVLAVNLGGVINGVVTFLPDMRSQRFGHIVNTGSMASFLASPGRSGLYATAKFAVRGLTEALRLSVADAGVGVSLLCPGAVTTRIAESSARQAPKSARMSGSLLPPTAVDMVTADEVATLMIKGVRANQQYIFTHPGFRDEIGEECAALLAAIPSGPPACDPFNVSRRDRITRARQQLAAVLTR